MDFPSSNYTYGAHGGLSGLDSPPVEFWPVYCCITVGHVTRREIEGVLDNMLSRGMRGVYVYPITNTFGADSKIDEDDYLGDAYMDIIAAFVVHRDDLITLVGNEAFQLGQLFVVHQ